MTYNKQEMTWNDLQQPTMSKKWPKMTYNEQETTWNTLKQVRHNLQWPEHTYNEQRKYAKWTTTSRFSDYFTIWGKQFSSLTHFPPTIWLQLFEHCFTENLGENKASSIYYHVSSINYHVNFLRDIRFIFFWVSFGLQHFHLLEEFNDEWGLHKQIQEPYYIFLLSKPL